MTVRVGQVTRREPLALPAGTTLLEAARTMGERQADDALVLDFGVPRGIVTRRDVTVRAVAEGWDVSCASLAEVCRRPLVTVTPEDTVELALEQMRLRGVSRLAVIDEEGSAGILSLGQLTEADRAPASV
jgi:CBS domain-containing protein